jgi:hypothetical protein
MGRPHNDRRDNIRAQASSDSRQQNFVEHAPSPSVNVPDRADADNRQFFDEFLCVKIPRLRAMGIVQLDAPHAVIRFGDKQKLIGLAHQVQAWRIMVLFPLPEMRPSLQPALVDR